MTVTTLVGPTISYGKTTAFVNALRSELLKIRSVPSTFWTLACAVVFNVVLAAVVAVLIPGRLSAADRKTTDSIQLSLAGLHLSQVAIGVLGVLVITSEYSTGMIRATLSAVPKRSSVLSAKAVVFAAAAVIGGTISSFAAYFAFEAFLPSDAGYMKTSLSDPGVLRAVMGGGLYLAVLGLLGLGLGAVLRSSAGAIAALFGLLFVPQIFVQLMPGNWRDSIGPYLLMNAGSDIFVASQREAASLSPWTGFGVFCLYAAIALTAGFVSITRRDA
ncbi:ABC transporter permease subunit [Streptomyces sp. NPDC005374]|uniref:ABC transporter permease subunit n=1 Tax=Streptomyces sp. NPDC005374 TaxID=3364713 RepID=UPI0036AE0D61